MIAATAYVLWMVAALVPAEIPGRYDYDQPVARIPLETIIGEYADCAPRARAMHAWVERSGLYGDQSLPTLYACYPDGFDPNKDASYWVLGDGSVSEDRVFDTTRFLGLGRAEWVTPSDREITDADLHTCDGCCDGECRPEGAKHGVNP